MSQLSSSTRLRRPSGRSSAFGTQVREYRADYSFTMKDLVGAKLLTKTESEQVSRLSSQETFAISMSVSSRQALIRRVATAIGRYLAVLKWDDPELESTLVEKFIAELTGASERDAAEMVDVARLARLARQIAEVMGLTPTRLGLLLDDREFVRSLESVASSKSAQIHRPRT